MQTNLVIFSILMPQYLVCLKKIEANDLSDARYIFDNGSVVATSR